MNAKRKIEIFSAGCPACDSTVEFVKSIACPSCEVEVLDMHDAAIAQRASAAGVQRVPAILVDGKLAECCKGSAVNEQSLRALGVGSPRP